MLCLVTGGAGFIGSHLTEALLRAGCAVRIADSFITGRRENLASVRSDVEIIEGDLADPEISRRAVAGAAVIFHQAALPSVPRSVADPFLAQRCGEVATLTLLDAAARAGVERVVYASSSSVYGDTPSLPKRESDPLRPLSPYAASKLAGEGYMSAFASIYRMDALCLRYFNVFGPRQDPHGPYSGVIAKFAALMTRDEPPTVYGDGESSRDFCFVDNVVAANLLAMRAPGVWRGESFNVACGERVSLHRLIGALNQQLGKNLAPHYAPARPGDIRDSLADISKARDRLGYAPTVGFEAGLSRLLLEA
jgi:UDP-glucose 4-epimerase